MIDWSAGYSSSWRLFRVDPATWADAEQVSGVTSVRIERDGSGDAPTIERGSLEFDMGVGETLATGYYRLVLTASQGGAVERVDVATLLCESGTGDADRGVVPMVVTGRSVLHPASVAHLTAGSYAPMGYDGAQYAAELLRGSINAPVHVAGGASFTLDQHVVMDAGCSVLEAAWLVLKAGNRVLAIDGRGEVTVMAMPTVPALTLDHAHARLMHTGVTQGVDLSDVPNRFVAVDGNQVATATNDEPASPVSTVSRGFVSDVFDKSPKRVNGETLDAYAARRLSELSTVTETREYSREWWPDVTPFSLVRGSLASVGLDGDMRVMRQSLTCGKGIVVEEGANREVSTWQT